MPSTTPRDASARSARDSAALARSDGAAAPRKARQSFKAPQPRPGAGTWEREDVARAQCARIVSAMSQVACEHGVANVSVAHVVARAGVSRRTFYELFGSNEDCLLAALREALDCARLCVLDAYDPAKPWRARIRAGLVALLCFLDEEPVMGRLLVVEALGSGPVALEHRQRVLERLAAAVDEGRREGRAGAPTPVLTGEGLVGAVLSVLHSRLIGGDGRPLLELANPLMSMIVLPYLGAAAARRELAEPLPRPLRRPARAVVPYPSELPMRLTYRTMLVLRAIAAQPGASNRQIGQAAGIKDQGQISKLLARLERLGLLANDGGEARGAANMWKLTARGAQIEQATNRPPGPRDRLPAPRSRPRGAGG